jgi:4-amino-4-deoxy-L-arabinose transferase-like glycosyltransferase
VTAPWAQYLWLGLITSLAAALRFYKLGEWSFWIDEIFTINRAMSQYNNAELIIDNIPPATTWAPISVILTAQVLNIGGINEWSARLSSAIIGTITIPILYFPTRKIFGPAVALIALLLLAASPWHIFWSQNARFYTSLLLIYTLAVFAFYFGIERNHPGYIVFFYFLVYLACSERLFALFIFPVIMAYLLSVWFFAIEKPPGLNKKMMFLLFLPFLAYVVFEILSWFWLGSSNIQEVADVFVGQVNTTPVRLSLSIAYRIGISILLLGFSGGLYTLMKKQRASLLIFIGAILPILLLVLLSVFMFTVDRYIFVTLFFWFILGALAIKELFAQKEGFVRLLPVGVLLVLLMTSLSEVFLYYQYQHGNRPDWKGAFLTVRQKMKAEDVIVVTRPELGEFYLRQNVTYINSVNSHTLENSSGRIWFVIEESTSPVKPDTKEWILQNTELVQVRELYLPGKNLSVYIYLYDPARKSRTWSSDCFASKGGTFQQIICVHRRIETFA